MIHQNFHPNSFIELAVLSKKIRRIPLQKNRKAALLNKAAF